MKMKKLLKWMPLLLVTVLFGALAAACDDDDKVISENELPASAKTFVSTYFASAKVATVYKDRNEYEVMLSDGVRIDFNKSGEWKDVDAPLNKELPTGFYPEAIDTYLLSNMDGAGINEISKERYGYDVELVTGIDLKFDSQGAFLRYDD